MLDLVGVKVSGLSLATLGSNIVVGVNTAPNKEIISLTSVFNGSLDVIWVSSSRQIGLMSRDLRTMYRIAHAISDARNDFRLAFSIQVDAY